MSSAVSDGLGPRGSGLKVTQLFTSHDLFVKVWILSLADRRCLGYVFGIAEYIDIICVVYRVIL